MEERAYQICIRCVMDTTHREIRFDNAGICNFCHAYERDARTGLLPAATAARELTLIIAEVKRAGQGREYDCILGVSGGVDSSFLAYKLTEFGLRILAVQFDNGWNSELAVKNIELICRRLGIDLFTYVVNWNEFRDLQLSFLKASVANVEAPSDHGIAAALYHVAVQRGIKYIMSGTNLVTEQITVPSYGYRAGDLRQLEGIHRRFGSIPLSSFPRMSFLKCLFYQKFKGIRMISPLNYMPYVKTEAMKILEEKLDWRNYGGKHFESIITRFHQSYILPRKFKLDKRRAHLSNLIFSGQITREQALEELKTAPCPPDVLKADHEFVLKKLKLSEKEFDELMAMPPVNYDAYPNQDWLYRCYAKAAGFAYRIRSKRKS